MAEWVSGRVSLVVPAYNAERHVGETIESLLAQDYDDLEIVAVDDGSTDGTGEVLERYADRITVCHQANAGQSAAMAAGWSLTRGEVIGYLSADDCLRPAAVRRVVEPLLTGSGIVCAYPDFDVIDTQSRRLSSVTAPEFSRRRLYADFVCLPGPGALVRRDAYESVGPWRTDLRQIPDLEFFLRLGLRGEFVRVPETLADFRMHPGSATYRPGSVARCEEPVAVVRDLLARPDLPADVRGWGREARASAHLLAATMHARARRPLSVLRHLALAAQAPRLLFSAKTVGVVATGAPGLVRLRRRARDFVAERRRRGA